MESPLLTHRLLDYKDFSIFSDIFIETGSAAGDGIQRAIDANFRTIISIEASNYWWEICVKRFEQHRNVRVLLGYSTDILNNSFFNSFINQTVIFFLDAHPSGPLSAGHDDLMEKGNSSAFYQDNIISNEIAIIMKKFPRSIILIDDMNGFDKSTELHMQEILSFDKSYSFTMYDENLSGELLYENKILVALPGVL